MNHLRVFGCVAYAHVPDSERQKLDKKAVKLRFVGYAKTSKGYRLLDGKTEKIVTRRDVVFNETNFSLETEPEPAKPQEVVVEVEGSMEHRRQQEVPPEVGPRRSDRDHRRPVRFGFDEYVDVATVENCVHHFSYSACQITEPKTMEEMIMPRNGRLQQTQNLTHLQRARLGNSWNCLLTEKQLDVSGCSKSNMEVTAVWNDSKDG